MGRRKKDPEIIDSFMEEDNEEEMISGEDEELENAKLIIDDLEIETDNELLPAKVIFPPKLGLIVVFHRPLFPHMVIPLVVEGELFQAAIRQATSSKKGYIGIVLAKDSFKPQAPRFEDLYNFGVVARIAKVFSQEENSTQVLCDVLGRFKIISGLKTKPFLIASVDHIPEVKIKIDDEIQAFSREILSNMKELTRLNPLIKEEINQFINQINIDDPTRLADFAATLTSADHKQLQSILETLEIIPRLEKTLLLIKKELDLSRLQAKISRQIEERISEHQREFFLREQLKEIQKELGISKDEKIQEIEKLKARAAKLSFSKEAKDKFKEELEKISLLDIHSPEFSVSRNYLDWLTLLPWGVLSKDNLNLDKATRVLDNDHYGLEDIKERIIEFIATAALRKKLTGTILCFVGPPGVGKTSIGKSIARALNRKFFRFSVGGMRDEAEIKGHRRTYIGAMPGKFIQALKTLKYANPVIMLDEIDKIGNSFQGDPASALLEALDPEQNSSFLDHYLDTPFDLSNVFFITTANQLDSIPAPLLDRMEVLRLSGYIAKEKLKIAKKYLIPKQRKEHGLTAKNFSVTDAAISVIIEGYAREAGVRNLENQIKKICRKVATGIAKGTIEKASVGAKEVEKYLKSPQFDTEKIFGEGKPGVVTGLAWTSMGGAILSIEAEKMISDRKGFKQTGQLGNVMVESSEIAYSYVISNAKKFGINPEDFKINFIHIHVPAGATPKDGPSAGVTMSTALISLLLQRPVSLKVGMTGELTLTGEVLPIGGLKEKIIAARRVGLKTIIIPHGNKKDYNELPDHLKEKLTIHFAKTYDDVFKVAFS